MSAIPHTAGRLSLLFLGGAKRVTMAQMIKKACADRGLDCDITGYELDSHSALAAVGTVVEGIRWSDPAIFGDLDSLCHDRGIDIVLPFVDGAVGIAADFAQRHSTTGVFAPTGTRADVDRMFDKCAAAEFFESHDLPVPPTYRAGAPCGKLIAKPRFGSASKGIIAIDSLQKIYELGASASKYLIQERIDNREEITVDCYVGMSDGFIAAASPRLRGEVSGGEAVRTETIADADAVSLAERVLRATGLRGAVTVQLIRDLDNGRLMVMEVNPRLGGGAVASVHAGVDIPGLIIDDALGRPLSRQTPVAGVETVRYLADFVFYP
ncbi:MAG: ATP-grasp domain-containing protein [Muribaculaceae bacterium]|nr:ATP-grasp domain-containing protein [Muribaculaceae bacterium]